MKAHLSRRYRISASHRLYSPAYNEEHNRAVYGKCSNPHGHGHNYVVEVTVAGPVDVQTGMVCNLADLDNFIQREVVERFDHANLNLDPSFLKRVPTTENFCIAVYDLVSAKFDKATLERVRIEETANNWFEYAGDDSRKQETKIIRHA